SAVSDLVTFVAVVACALFAGAAVYINLVEHPGRLACGTEVAARQWAPGYKRATVMQAPPAVNAALAGLARWPGDGGVLWLGGAVSILAVVPVTLLVIFRTNTRLLEPGRDLASAETHRLLVAWGRLHGIRSVLSLIASALYVWAAIHR